MRAWPSILSPPEPASYQDVLQDRRLVRHDPVYAEIDEPTHLRWLIDGPHMDLEAQLVRVVDQGSVDHPHAPLDDGKLGAAGRVRRIEAAQRPERAHRPQPERCPRSQTGAQPWPEKRPHP